MADTIVYEDEPASSKMPPPVVTPAVCSVKHVRKAYGDTHVLRGVSFDIAAGERVALMGPSGSGKSTLLHCLSGIDRADSGSITMAGVDLDTATPEELAAMRRTAVSTVFQFFHLLPTLTAFENIELSLQLAGHVDAPAENRVRDLLAAVGLEDRAQAFPETLSGGERQRVAIARALAHRPKLILADEPTGSLDSTTGADVLELLEDLAEQNRIAMLLVTHSETATRICHRVLRMQDGQLI